MTANRASRARRSSTRRLACPAPFSPPPVCTPPASRFAQPGAAAPTEVIVGRDLQAVHAGPCERRAQRRLRRSAACANRFDSGRGSTKTCSLASASWDDEARSAVLLHRVRAVPQPPCRRAAREPLAPSGMRENRTTKTTERRFSPAAPVRARPDPSLPCALRARARPRARPCQHPVEQVAPAPPPRSG